ncbi:MAG: ubiquinol-cytochrome c reductase iron-sulfur subunit [Trueperaceae bacterium]
MAEQETGDRRQEIEETPNSKLQTPAPDESRRKLVTWLWRLPVLAVIGGASYAAYEAFFHLNRLEPSPTPTFVDREAQRLASISDFANVWDVLEFTFDTPSLLVRLPKLIPGGLQIGESYFAAFSRICTHQGCIVHLNKNLEAVAVAFNHRSDEPVLSCQCHYSVFSAMSSGKAVSGPAVKPLPRVRLEQRENALYATGVEIVRL